MGTLTSSYDLGVDKASSLFASFEDPSKLTCMLPEQIANKLAESIICGHYAPGQHLQETALANTFGVSRGPIRDALRILEQEGLVKIQARRGTTVATLSPKDVSDIFEVRAAVFGVAAAELARQRSPDVLAMLDNCTEVLIHAFEERNGDHFLALAYRLSMFVADASGNRYARNILFSFRRQTLSLTRKVMMIEENRKLWLANWKAIANTIRKGDPGAAEEAARTLVKSVHRAAREILRADVARRPITEGPAAYA